MQTHDVTIAGNVFAVPLRYAAGHVITEGEASALNQTLCENVRNNLAPKIKKELAEGKTLELMLNDGPLEPKSALNMMRGICDGLEHAHALGLVHRDIKPANIFVTGYIIGNQITICLIIADKG